MPQHIGHYAMVVGIDDYPRFRSLKGARKDAQEFYDWLIAPEGGDVPEENIELILSKEGAEKPIQEDIDDALDELLLKAKARGFDDTRLYFYFSGHGLARSNVCTNMCIASWSEKQRGRALDSNGYIDFLMGCGLFREVVFLLDCCRVRILNASARMPDKGLPPPGDGAPRSRLFVAFATEFTNAAYEANTGQVDEDAEVRGNFTRALIDALKGGAAEPTGRVTATRLKNYLEVYTPLIAMANNYIQNPEVKNGLNGDPLFGNAQPPALASGFSVNIVFKSVSNGEAVVEDGHLNVLKRGDVSTGPWSLKINNKTMLMVRMLTSGQSITIRVNGDEQEDLHVEF